MDKGGTVRSAADSAYRQVVTLTRSNERSRVVIATGFLGRNGSFSPSPINLHFQQNLNKDDTIGKQECRGSKREGEGGGGWGGGLRQITFDPKIVNGSLTGSMLWEVYGLWLSGPVCTKVMRLWKGPWIDSFFLLCVVQARAPRHSYHWAVTARRGVTLWKHTGFHWS